MVAIGGKDNDLEYGNHIATSMSIALDLWPFALKFNREYLPLMGSPYVWYDDP
jgi:hypothetical protein